MQPPTHSALASRAVPIDGCGGLAGTVRLNGLVRQN
jgi:hypothetical protein